MHIQEVIDLVKDDMLRVEEEFRRNLKSEVRLIGKVAEYILNSGGKRFRPLTLLLCARLCGYRGGRHIPLAAVVEFIHTATLLHDDVVDNAHLRRGNAAANTIWGEGASILVGDYLLSKAFYMAVADSDIEVLRVLARTTTRMAEGEVLQLLRNSDIETTEEEYLDVVTNKTAVLISAAAELSAILARTSKAERAAMARFGMGLGIAYQLADDCLDYSSSDESLGKSVGNDLREGKVTMPLIHAYRHATESEKDFLRRAIEADDIDDSVLKDVLSLINKYKGIEYTFERAKSYVEEAKKELEVFEPNIERAALMAVADYVNERTC